MVNIGINRYYWKGKSFSEEHKRKIGLGNKGKIVSEETKIKLSKINKGKKLSEEHKKKISLNMRGSPPWNKGILHTEETKEKISKATKGRISPRKGKHLSKETKMKLSMAHKGIPSGKKGKTYEELYGIEKARELKKITAKTHKGNTNRLSKLHTKETKEKMRQVKLKNPTRYWEGKLRSKKTREKIRSVHLKLWQTPKYRAKMIPIVIKNRNISKRPTSFEEKIIFLIEKYNLPFDYVGDGKVLIKYKNPDFINEKKKQIIEVYFNYFKIRDFGSCENYEKQRTKIFAKKGYKTLYLRSEDILRKDWEQNCLEKIRNFEYVK